MRVLLVNPPNVGKFGLQNIFQPELLGLESIAGTLVADHDVSILDQRWEPDLEGRLEQFRPDLVGISCLYTNHTGATREAARRVKVHDPSIRTVVGGQPPSLGPQLYRTEGIDYVVRGDGERTMAALCAALESDGAVEEVEGLAIRQPDGRQLLTPPRPRPSSLSELARPLRDAPGVDRRRHFLSLSRPIGMMEITRGCPFDCNFCTIWRMADGRVRSLEIDTAVEELASIPESAVFFADDHFFSNPAFMLELGRAIVEADLGKSFNVQSRADVFVKHPELIPVWKQAGLNLVFIGFEGADDGRLDSVRKRTTQWMNERAVDVLRENGIGIVGNLMVDPRFGREEFRRLRDYVRERAMDFVSFCIATPFPGTDLWTERASEIVTRSFDLFDIQHAVTPTKLPLEEFYREYAACWELRAELQPRAHWLYTIRRVTQMLIQSRLRTDLLRNARRFERLVVDPQAYLEDHVAEPDSNEVQAVLA